jgi:hypothetical protein
MRDAASSIDPVGWVTTAPSVMASRTRPEIAKVLASGARCTGLRCRGRACPT